MDEKPAEAPFPREPWRRLLENSAEAPPETIDARIRAAARRGLGTRGRRWWLPASLAASFLLAVLLVHSQFGTNQKAVVTESDQAAEARMHAGTVEHSASKDVPAAKAATRSAAATRGEPSTAKDEIPATPEDAAGTAGTGPLIGGPERDIRSSSEMPQASAATPAAGMTASPAAAPPMVVPSPAAATNSAQAKEAAREESLAGHALATPPTPEAWYAAIEQLRAEGHTEEADRELERLKKAWPGWLERHLGQSSQH